MLKLNMFEEPEEPLTQVPGVSMTLQQMGSSPNIMVSRFLRVRRRLQVLQHVLSPGLGPVEGRFFRAGGPPEPALRPHRGEEGAGGAAGLLQATNPSRSPASYGSGRGERKRAGEGGGAENPFDKWGGGGSVVLEWGGGFRQSDGGRGGKIFSPFSPPPPTTKICSPISPLRCLLTPQARALIVAHMRKNIVIIQGVA